MADLASARRVVDSAQAAIGSLGAEESLAAAGVREAQTAIAAADAQRARAGADQDRYDRLAASRLCGPDGDVDQPFDAAASLSRPPTPTAAAPRWT